MSHDLSDADRAAILEASGYTSLTQHGADQFGAIYHAGFAAGRARALEKAAKVCVDFSNDELLTLDARYGAAECCGLIRALLNPPA